MERVQYQRDPVTGKQKRVVLNTPPIPVRCDLPMGNVVYAQDFANTELEKEMERQRQVKRIMDAEALAQKLDSADVYKVWTSVKRNNPHKVFSTREAAVYYTQQHGKRGWFITYIPAPKPAVTQQEILAKRCRPLSVAEQMFRELAKR